jgi:hypothetical protein
MREQFLLMCQQNLLDPRKLYIPPDAGIVSLDAKTAPTDIEQLQIMSEELQQIQI